MERCDYGSRKIDFVVSGSSLAVRFSDGGGPEPLVDVHPLHAGESAEAGVTRVFQEKTPPALAARCVLSLKPQGVKPRKGATHYTFVPNAAFAKELAKTARADEVGDPPCGDWGEAPDGIQYFESQPGARAVLFVRAGQDTPLFDERTLRILAR